MPRPISIADLAAIKTATHDLVRACGGIDRAAMVAGLSKSTVARAYAARDEREPDEPSWATLDLVSVVLLERDLAERGDPARPVTACLARLGGRDLADAGAIRARASVAAAARAVMPAFGEFAADLTAALGDGAVTPSEGATIDAKVAHLQTTLTELRASLAAVRAREA